MASVLITSADDGPCAEAARQLELAGHTVHVGSEDHVLDSLDVLVNNAAHETFEANVAGLARVLQAFLPLLERSPNPLVVNVGTSDAASAAAVNVVTVQYAKTFPQVRFTAVEHDAEAIVRTALTGQDE